MNIEIIKERLEKFFDKPFYLERYPDVAAGGMLPLEHYTKIGWSERRRPNRWFTSDLVPRDLSAKHPDLPDFILFLAFLPQLDEQRFHALCIEGRHVETGHADCWDCDMVRAEFNGAYYRQRYPDIGTSVDALAHFCSIGWKERRHPNAAFDTDYYLSVYEDIAAAAINPFVHFVTRGRREGRKAAPCDAPERKLLRSLRSFREAAEEYTRFVPTLQPQSQAALFAQLFAQCAQAKGLCLSLSHDNYLKSTGGIQKFIKDEGIAARVEGYAYLHMAPAFPSISLASESPEILFLVNCSLNDEFLGTFTAAEVGEALAGIALKLPKLKSIAVLHSLMGWNRNAIYATVGAQTIKKYFYLHDYFSLCTEYKLLRNNLVPCDAPPPDSPSCKVCAHGKQRADHLAIFDDIFGRLKPELIFPSNCARQVFEGGYRGAPQMGHTVPHLEVRRREKPEAQQSATGRIRIAFCGDGVAHKGFYAFEQIVDQCIANPHLEFFHFGSNDSRLPGVGFVQVKLKGGKSVMADALRHHGIDLVFAGSTWRETFNFVAYEAVEAGAGLLALASTGNVADFVQTNACGAVCADWQAVAALLGQETLRSNTEAWKAAAEQLSFIPNKSVFTKGILK